MTITKMQDYAGCRYAAHEIFYIICYLILPDVRDEEEETNVRKSSRCLRLSSSPISQLSDSFPKSFLLRNVHCLHLANAPSDNKYWHEILSSNDQKVLG